MQYFYKLFSVCAVLIGLLFVQTAYAQVTQQNVPQGSASLNWSGYVAQTGTYTSVTGTWTIPTVSNTDASADATWVGIGGVASNDLIQAGTQAIVENGSVTYNAWFETLPDFAQTVQLAVSPGDSITSTVAEVSGDTWQITIKDNTTGQQYSGQVQYASSLSSAEWVEEMVSNGNNTFRPLDSFGNVSFTGGSAVVNGQTESISQSGAQPLQMINRAGSALATTSALGSDGASFSVARTSAEASVAQTMPQGGYPGRWRVVSTATSTGGQPQTIPTTTTRHHRANSGGFGLSSQGFGQGGFFSIPGFNLPQQVTQFINQNLGQTGASNTSSSSPNTQTYQVGNWTIQVTQF